MKKHKKIVKRAPRVKKAIRSLKSRPFKKVAHPFGIAEVWDRALSAREIRPVEKRDRLWATDMAKGYVDVFFSMRGEQPSNPPNARALRKFEAGDVFEWVVKNVLIRAGLLRAAQIRVEYQYKNLLPMSGKIDYLVGGKPELKKIEAELATMDVPEAFKRASWAIVRYIDRKYPGGLPEMPFEIKSIASFGADAMEKKNRSIQAHRAQLKFYLNGSRYERGMLIYICRDDLRMFEFEVTREDKETEKEIKTFCATITDYWRRNERPAVEPDIIFDWDAGKFSKNLKIEYSAYLTKVYGLKEPREYSEGIAPLVSRWNRVVSRIKHGEAMTKNNKEAIEEMKEWGFSVKKIIREYANGEE
jgi:hypothetical protein